MCEWGTHVELEVTIPAHLSCTGADKRRVMGIDACIAPLVTALNAAGLATIGSCCGHGKRPGVVALADGREIYVLPDAETARRVDRLLMIAFSLARQAWLAFVEALFFPILSRVAARLGVALRRLSEENSDAQP